jgi:DNA-binding NtrC family response regulator
MEGIELRTLLVADDVATKQSILAILRALECTVTIVGTVDNALKKIDQIRGCNLIVIDSHILKRNHEKVASKIKEENPNLKVLVMTYNSEDEEDKIIGLVGWGILKLPLNFGDVKEAISQIMRN